MTSSSLDTSRINYTKAASRSRVAAKTEPIVAIAFKSGDAES